jgi:hypothetical protein
VSTNNLVRYSWVPVKPAPVSDADTQGAAAAAGTAPAAPPFTDPLVHYRTTAEVGGLAPYTQYVIRVISVAAAPGAGQYVPSAASARVSPAITTLSAEEEKVRLVAEVAPLRSRVAELEKEKRRLSDYNAKLSQQLEDAKRALAAEYRDKVRGCGCRGVTGAGLDACAGFGLPEYLYNSDRGHRTLLAGPGEEVGDERRRRGGQGP